VGVSEGVSVFVWGTRSAGRGMRAACAFAILHGRTEAAGLCRYQDRLASVYKAKEIIGASQNLEPNARGCCSGGAGKDGNPRTTGAKEKKHRGPRASGGGPLLALAANHSCVVRTGDVGQQPFLLAGNLGGLEFKKMRILAFCSACIREAMESGPQAGTSAAQVWASIPKNYVDIEGEFAFRIDCPRDHKEAFYLDVPHHELLFDAGVMSLERGAYREAVFSFAASRERFVERYLRVIAHARGRDFEAIENCWKALDASSERQVGAFFWMGFVENGLPPEDVKKAEDWASFRNRVVHRGVFPSRQQTIEYGQYHMTTTDNVSVDQEIQQLRMKRPHVVILGAGASVAACPNGDRLGRRLPVMSNFVEVLSLGQLIPQALRSLNFEEAYSSLVVDSECAKEAQEIEQRIYDYFSELDLPEEVTIYDYLVLALQPKDVIATFNWDPLLIQAVRRHQSLLKSVGVPTILCLHGNVIEGYCFEDMIFGINRALCSKCGKPFTPSRLLYPVSQKNCSESPFINRSWQVKT
jgi:hypothetical protein